MAHGDYNCCAVCDRKLDYNAWESETKEQICTDCLKALRAEGLSILDPHELIDWMKSTPEGIVKATLERCHFRICYYSNPVDDCYNEVVGKPPQESAIDESKALTYDDALKIARGCVDYGGGYRADDGKLEIFHHGIQTVVNALELAGSTELRDLQSKVLHERGQPQEAAT